MLSRRRFVGSTLSASLLHPATSDLDLATLADLSSSLRAKKLSAIELTQSSLERINRLNGRLNAFITTTEQSALSQAKALQAELDRGRRRGPLHGIPIALKDLYDTSGVRTTAGSRHWSDRVPSADAEVVRRLKNAGAVIVGKTNMDEFAYNFTGETSAFGQCWNPWRDGHTPGGSSGGSAVAVAAGMCSAALGSDTGGSIRLPASFCGITGYKPTYGMVDLTGAAPLAWSLDHAGPMCRSALDAVLLLEAMSGKAIRPAADSLVRLRIGIPRATFYDDLDPEVAGIVARATEALGKLTSGVRDIPTPPLPSSKNLPDLPETYIRIIAAEAYAYHESMLRERPQLYNDGTRQSIAMGAPVTAAEYIGARREMDRLRAESGKLFEAAEVLVTPTAPGPAFPIGERRLVYLRNTAPWNLLGLPTISVPCGFTKTGLPVGMQITGPAGRDNIVLALAIAYQHSTDWHRRRPPVSVSSPARG